MENFKKTPKACFLQACMENSDQQSTQSAALIGSNDDLLTEILLRLPATSIIRFKSVSKHWRFLLSHRHFTHRYDKLSKSPGIFAGNTYVSFDVKTRTTPPFHSLDFYFDRSGVSIVQSCNGLLLCYTDGGTKDYINSLTYYVFNPTTKQLELIPSVPGGLQVGKSICFMGLAFHPTDCVHYELVCIRPLEPVGKLFQIQIYSSDSRKWKISFQSFSASIPIFRHGIYCNGVVYWVPDCRDRDILYFKIDDEQLQTLPLPVGLISSKIQTMYLGESRGHLHAIVYKQENGLRLNVHELLSDHSGWFVKYQLQLDELLGTFPEMMIRYGYGLKVIDVVRGEKEEDAFMVLITSKRMIRYNVHDRSFKQISSFDRYSFGHYRRFYRYIETLSSF